LGEAAITGSPFTIRLKGHRSEESYRDRENEIIPLVQPHGQRSYLHARPYVLLPDIELTIAIARGPLKDGAIGTVIGSEVRGMREQMIGNAQSWYYPADRTAILWECYLFDWCRHGENPLADEALVTLWTGFERVVREQFPEATRIATPSWENLYDRTLWESFLRTQNYKPFTRLAFLKDFRPAQQL
jgi:hypothetical protein